MNNIPDNEDIRLAEEQRLERAHRESGKGRCPVCQEEVVDGEDHYAINGELIHADCVLVWLDQYRVA